MDKKIIIIIIIVAIVGIIAFFAINNKPTIEVEEVTAEEKPYVEANNFELLSALDTLEIPIEPYAKDEKKNIFSPDGISFENTKSSYTFYDYSVSEPDETGYVTHTFKYDVKTPVVYSIDTNKTIPKWSRSFALQYIQLFDYYTGDIYKSEDVTLKGINFYNANTDNDAENEEDKEEKKMQYTYISWKNRNYKIGVRTEAKTEWEGKKETNNNDGTKTISDVNNATIYVYVYAPKEFDGIMIGLFNQGTNKEDAMVQIEAYNRYYELLSEAENSNEKSEELIKAEEMYNKTFKLLEYKYDENITFSSEDYYVFRLTEMKKQETE